MYTFLCVCFLFSFHPNFVWCVCERERELKLGSVCHWACTDYFCVCVSLFKFLHLFSAQCWCRNEDCETGFYQWLQIMWQLFFFMLPFSHSSGKSSVCVKIFISQMWAPLIFNMAGQVWYQCNVTRSGWDWFLYIQCRLLIILDCASMRVSVCVYISVHMLCVCVHTFCLFVIPNWCNVCPILVDSFDIAMLKKGEKRKWYRKCVVF